MKRRYYPYITFVAAALLTVAPLSLLFLFSTSHNLDGSPQAVPELAEVQSRAKQPSHTQQQGHGRLGDADTMAADKATADTATARLPDGIRDAHIVHAENGPTNGHSLTKSSSGMASVLPNTLVAMADVPVSGTVSDSVTGNVYGLIPGDLSVSDMSTIDLMADLAEPTTPPITGQAIKDADSSPQIEIIPGAVASVPDSGNKAPLAEEAAPAVSYYDSTRHLAMLKQQPTDPANTNSGHAFGDKGSTSDKVQSDAADNSSRASSKRRSRSGNRDAGGPNTEDAETIETARMEDGTVESHTTDPLLEDVVIQTHSEQRPVSRIENLMAMTRAKGWPVALVRSDLPGDDWWVQQMVGIHGNAFSARVNFGNEQSIAGSVYRLVFVFLDSPDEVRRFRIAKQFKEIPEGIRHSREFFFVRQ